MKTINSDFIRSYDKFKDDVFHSKKEQIKADLKSKQKKPEPLPLKKIFPWKTLTKLTVVTGLAYLTYNYSQTAIDSAIKKNYMTAIDLISLKVLRQDALIKFKTLIKHPQQLSKVSHFSNYMFQNLLQKDFQSLRKTYPVYQVKSSIESRFKLWIFQFKNFERSQYINEFGDVIEREENSALRIWRYPLIKDRKQKVIEEQKLHQYYRTLLHKEETYDHQKLTIENEIKNKCERINILNRFSSQYDELMVECRKNQTIGKAILEQIRYRKKLYPYPQIDLQVK